MTGSLMLGAWERRREILNNVMPSLPNFDNPTHLGCVYVWVNLYNGNCYIGKTGNFWKRRKQHFRAKGHCRVFNLAIKKYGTRAFAPLIRQCPIESMNAAEVALIAAFKSAGIKLYNLTNGGEGGVGCVPSKKTREILRLATQSLWRNPEYRNRVIATKRSPENRERARRSSRAAMTTEWRAKISKRSIRDITSQRFSRWQVICRDSNSNAGVARWLCRCDCGVEKVVNGSNLRLGLSTSCGCLKAELSSARMKSFNPMKRRGVK